MPNGTYGGVRGRKTKVGGKLLRFPPTRLLGSPVLPQQCAEREIAPLLQTEQKKGGHGTIAELTAELQVELRAVDALPCITDKGESPASLGRSELTAMDMIEHIDINEVEPTDVLIFGDERSCNTCLHHLHLHAEISCEIIETSDRDPMCGRGRMLEITINTCTSAHTP